MFPLATSRKHHFLPVSYLSRWTNTKGLLQVVRRFGEKIHWSELPPAATAREIDLYSYSSNFEVADPAEIETTFFQKLDSRGAEILGKIECDKDLSRTEVVQWCQYLLNFRTRSPDVVKTIRDGASEMFREHLAKDPEEYESAKPDDAPDTMEEYVEENHPGLIESIGVGQIPKIANSKAIADLMEFDMNVFNCEAVSYRLLCSDRPLVMTTGLQRPLCAVCLPISPTKMVVHARRSSGIIDNLQRRDVSEVVKRVNIDVISQAKSRVYAQKRSDAPDRLLLRWVSDSSASED